MRIDDGGGSVATTPPPAPAKPVAKPSADAHDAPMAGQGAQSTATWPGGPDSIDLKGATGPVLRMLREEAQQDYDSGTFNDGSYPQSQNDRRIAQVEADPVARRTEAGQPLTQNDTYYLNQYVAGKTPGQDATTAPQRLQNALAALGPQASANWLQSMSDGDYKSLGVANSFGSLVSSGKLSPADARAFADGDAANDTGTNPNLLPSTVGSLVAGLGNDANSSAFKNAYAHQSINAAESITTNLASNRYEGETANEARTERTMLYGQATAALDTTPDDDSAKRAAFTQMTADANALSSGPASDKATADKINAFAADALGGASSAAIAKQFTSMGGVGPGNAIAPNSALGKFLSSAVAGQASFGTDPLYTGMQTPPSGVSRLLGSLSQGSDPNLTQAVLSNVLQTFVAHPDQASALQSQDAAYGTGLQKSLGDALSSSFDSYLTRNGKAGVDSSQALELSVLGGIESGPPFENGQGKNYETMMQNKAASFSQYALGKQSDPAMAKLFWNDPNSRKGALEVSTTLMQSYLAGAGAQQASEVARANDVTSPNAVSSAVSKVQDLTTIFAAIPGDLPGQGLAAGAATVAGVVGALQDAGAISGDPSSGAKKALAQLASADARSGIDSGVASMQAAYKKLEDASHNEAIANDPFFGAASTKTLVNGNIDGITGFFGADDAPVVTN